MATAVAPLNDGDVSPLDSREWEGISVAAVALVGRKERFDRKGCIGQSAGVLGCRGNVEWELPWVCGIPGSM